MSVPNNLRTRIAVAVANWILRTFAPEYAQALDRLVRRELGRANFERGGQI